MSRPDTASAIPAASSIADSTSDAAQTVSSSTQSFEIVSSFKSFSMERKLAKLPCFMVEERLENKRFYNREETFGELDAALLLRPKSNTSSMESMARHAVLCGVPVLGSLKWQHNMLLPGGQSLMRYSGSNLTHKENWKKVSARALLDRPLR